MALGAVVVAVGVLCVLQSAAASTGACTAADQRFILAHSGTGADSFGQMSSTCGYKAYSIFDGFSVDIFKKCIEGKGLKTDACAGCYANAGAYGAANCKWDCMDSWCSQDCLGCVAKYAASLDACTGFPEEKVAACSSAEDHVATEAAGACTAADQRFISAHPGTGADSFGQMSSTCGYKAYSIFDGFSVDIFKKCIKGKGLKTDACAGCYANAGAYGADNCKWDCMDSWCSQDCFGCVAKYAASLDACTGFPEEKVPACSSAEDHVATEGVVV